MKERHEVKVPTSSAATRWGGEVRAANVKHPLPLVAGDEKFFHRLHAAENPSSLRLRSHNQDPRVLELFIVATSHKWVCYKDEFSPLHCYECSQRQQRECALWALSRMHRHWSRGFHQRRNVRYFTEHPLVRKSRECLFLLWLRLRRVYRVPEAAVAEESEWLAFREKGPS